MAEKGLWKIQIERTDSGYQYRIEEPERSTITYRGDLEVPERIRTQISNDFKSLLDQTGNIRSAAAASADPTIDQNDITVDLQRLGERIFNLLISSECQDYLLGVDAEFVNISTNDVEIPWELMHDGEEFFMFKNDVGRTIEANKTISTDRPETNEFRVLLIGDPGLDLPGAKEEVLELNDMFETHRDVNVDMLIQEDANSNNLIFDYLEKNHYDIIHYAGHTSFDEQRPENSKIHLNDIDITAQYLMNLLNTSPRLMFLNSCSSSTSGGVEYWEQNGYVSGLASSIISSGVDHYVGTMWPVSDTVSKQISRSFYGELLDGTPVGRSLRIARSHAMESNQDPLSPSSFILYGDPRITTSGDNGASKYELVESTTYDSSRELCSQLGLNQVDVGFFGLNQALYRVQQGLGLRIVGVSAYSQGGVGIIAAPNSGIEQVSDLVNKNVGVAINLESAVNRWFQDTLVNSNVDPNDVATIDMSCQDHYRHIREERIDAVVTWDPWKTLAERFGTLVADDRYSDVRNYEIIAASEHTIKNNPEKVRDLLNTHFHIVDELANVEAYPDIYANRLGIANEHIEMVDDGYTRPTRNEHFSSKFESDLRDTINTELSFLHEQGFIQSPEIDEDTVTFDYIPEEVPPKTIDTEETAIGHNDALACLTGIERGYYI